MSSSLTHAAFRLGCFIVLVSGGLLLFEDRGTAEQAITLFTFLVGVVFLIIVAVAVRWQQKT